MKKCILLLGTLLFTLLTAQAQYEIKVRVDGLRDSNLVLGYSYENKRFAIDTAKMDSKGNAIFKKSTSLDKGVYFVALPDRTYFDMLMPENQNFSVYTKHPDMFNHTKFTSSPENQEFIEYQRYLGAQQKEARTIQERKKNNEEHKKDSVETYQQQLEQIDNDVKEYVRKLTERNRNNFLGTMMGVLQNVDVPDFDIPESVSNKDSLRQVYRYEYTRDHYFDNFNLSDNGLIRTPFFKSRLDVFFNNLIIPDPDTIIKYADMLIERSKENKEMFRYITEYFFQKYQASEIMSHDIIVVHLADKYYLSGKAYWADEEYLGKIKERADKLRPNLVGKIAPELLLQTIDGRYESLRKLRANYTILYFWEPNCGHCRKETPKLWDLYNKYRDKGVEVYAVYTQYKHTEWENYVNEHQYDWVNVWDGIEGTDSDGKQTTFSLGSNFRNLYDIYSTPVIYFLDKDKKILAKRIDVATLERMLDNELKDK